MMTAIESQDGEWVKQRYLTRVNQLYSDIRNWLKDQKELHLEQHAVEIGEDLTGFYTAPTLVVSSSTEKLAEFKPEGACIIEAEGRIDVLGWLGVEYIIYMVNGGPILGGQQMFKDIDANGWYWAENNLKNKAHFMNQENFFKLFTQATDYEL
ncbi:MAG: hypothetical protein DRQ49_05110 [Gammaproteobacteria bacterium]|nr:MAG: hypothetical protein DRQ49_05110 [Gammaproteobacteria bacterium]RKZ45091.1 MAG: hypothetical protein DRQ41_01160 [Gammaproteobacteria bacterium]RKZ76281.1 MAG: hypothetical protein DRQ57_04375 [Gammaproteobacteria bacterium]